MTSPKIDTLEDYEMFLGERIESWSPEQRLALAAAMAERWLPAYDAFSKAEEWGDANSLHHCLDAVWDHLLGVTVLSGSDRSRYIKQIRQVTPHMDDFDAIEALVACTILDDTVECCKMGNNSRHAIQALMSGFEALNPDWSLDPDEQPRLWQTGPIRKELRKQLQLLEKVEVIKGFNTSVVETLRQEMIEPNMVGEVQAREEVEANEKLVSNQAIFEQYRRIIEMDNRSKDPNGADFKPEELIFSAMLFGEWSGRYHRRLTMLTGTYGKLADKRGLEALLARQREKDSRVTEIPNWDEKIRWIFDLAVKNPLSGMDVDSLEKPHGYGPSLRSLWMEAKKAGIGDEKAHLAIIAWARHRPEAWREMDERKKKGLLVEPELGDYLRKKVTWVKTGEPGKPWNASVDGMTWGIRINDFPDDYFYTLLINDNPAGNFNDWPETWLRD